MIQLYLVRCADNCDQFIWDHSFETYSSETYSSETYSSETYSSETYSSETIHLRPIHLRPIHLRPIHLRPHPFETTSIWDHIHLRPHPFETTSIWDHIHLRSHSFYATLKWSCFDLQWITVLSTFHFLVGDLMFCKVTLHLKICKVTPFCVQGDSCWVVGRKTKHIILWLGLNDISEVQRSLPNLRYVEFSGYCGVLKCE